MIKFGSINFENGLSCGFSFISLSICKMNFATSIPSVWKLHKAEVIFGFE